MVRRGEVIGAEERAALSAAARQRSQTYWWLSEFFLAAPDAAAIANLIRHGREAVDSPEDAPLAARLRELAVAPGTADAAALAVEHARLFAGLGESYGLPPPYEALHPRIAARENPFSHATEAYRAAGFDRIDVPAVPQDHLAVELRFMALLAAQESPAWGDPDIEAARTLVLRERLFLDEHLLAWVPAYCERIATETREPFYAAAARMTAEALAQDRKNIDDLLRVAAPA